MEPTTAKPGAFRPWRQHESGRLDARRRELFALAAPVFRRDGYRGATIKALAHACGLSPASLYHYFRSKEELATYLVRRPRMDWDSTWVDPSTDPLVQLAQLIDLSLAELPNYLLALRLADEIDGAVPDAGAHARTFREGEAVFARLIAASAPDTSRASATRVARDALSAMVGSAVVGLDPEPDAAVRARVVTASGQPSSQPMSSQSGSTRRCAEPNRPPDRFGTQDASVDETVRVTRQKESLMRPVSRLAMAAALTLSAASMLAHNLYELPLSPIDPENSGPILFAAILGVAYALRPDSKAVAAATLGWGVLNLVIGGIVTVLPLPILPFVPEQSVTHYGAHVVYTLGQAPLVVLGYRAVRAPAAAGDPAGSPARQP